MELLPLIGELAYAPDRPTLRFPAEKERVAAQKIAESLDQLGVGQGVDFIHAANSGSSIPP